MMKKTLSVLVLVLTVFGTFSGAAEKALMEEIVSAFEIQEISAEAVSESVDMIHVISEEERILLKQE